MPNNAIHTIAAVGIAWGVLCLVRGRGGTRYAMGPALVLVGLWVFASVGLPSPSVPTHQPPAQPAAVVHGVTQ